MIVQGMAVGPLQANCYIIGCEKTRKAVVIDPGDDVDHILLTLADNELTLETIIDTHAHFDHVGGNRRLKEVTGAKLAAHKLDAPMLDHLPEIAAAWGMKAEPSPPPDIFLDDGDVLNVGELELKILHTPGHSLGSISIYVEDMVFVGDLLFAGSIGRTDFPGGDYSALINSVRTKIFPLGDDVKVYSGHGPVTTVGHEKRTNPFFQN